MGLQVALADDPGDMHVEIGLHLVDEADVLARELEVRTGQRAQMRRDVVGAGRIEVIRDFGGQPLGCQCQVGGIGERVRVLHLLTQGRVAGEGVDVIFLDPIEAQTEQQIFADQGGVGVHGLNGKCKTERMPRLSEPSPYVEFDRSQWRALRMSTPMKLTEDEVLALRGLGEKLDLLEVEEVYLPLARLIHLQVAARQRLFAASRGVPR